MTYADSPWLAPSTIRRDGAFPDGTPRYLCWVQWMTNRGYYGPVWSKPPHIVAEWRREICAILERLIVRSQPHDARVRRKTVSLSEASSVRDIWLAAKRVAQWMEMDFRYWPESREDFESCRAEVLRAWDLEIEIRGAAFAEMCSEALEEGRD